PDALTPSSRGSPPAWASAGRSERSRCAPTDPATCSTVDGVTEAPVDALRRRARTGLFDRAERAPARAHFRAMGVDPARLGGPIIGVASTWTGTMPCNLNQRELADRVSEGVAAPGGPALGVT